MKHITKIAILTLAVSGLLAGRNALAEPADAAAAAGKQESAGEPKKGDRWKAKKERMETLKSDLKLTANQEAAWTEWVGKIKGDRQGWEEKHKIFESWAGLPAIDRMEKMLAFSKERVAKEEARLAATRTFYATLTPEQQNIFDKGFTFWPHGGFGKHWKKRPFELNY